jgi:hypothetical protein
MADGGNVEFVEIDGLVVKLKLAGACGSCPSSLTTMTMGIKRRLMEKIPVSQLHVFVKGSATSCSLHSHAPCCSDLPMSRRSWMWSKSQRRSRDWS